MKLYTRAGYHWVNCKYWDPVTGTRKRVQRSTGIRDDGTPGSKRVASTIAEDIARGVAIGTNRRARTLTVSDAFEAARKAKKLAGRSAATLEILEQKQKQVLEALGASRPLGDVTAQTLAKYAAEALEEGRKPATVHRELQELTYGIRALGEVPPELPDLGKLYAPRERALSPEETRKLLAVVPEKRRDHIICYRLLGLRKSELDQIESSDINWVRRTVRIRGTKTDGSDRVLPLPNDVFELLKRRVQNGRVPLFEPWLRGNSDRDLKKWSRAAGLGPVSFNDLRRSFATELILKGESASKVAALLGHTSTRMVDQVYARLRAGEHLADTVAKLDSYLPDPTDEAPTLLLPRPGKTGVDDVTGMSPPPARNDVSHSYAWDLKRSEDGK